MLDPQAFAGWLQQAGVRFTAGVPDSLLKSLNAVFTASGTDHIAANEGGAVALAIGHHLATGDIPLVYLQNSGLGNTVNPLTSLADPAVYGIPLLLVIGWRGEPGVKDEPQHVAMGRQTPAVLDSVDVPYQVLSPEPETARTQLKDLLETARRRSGPVALLVRKDTFGPYRAPAIDEPAGLMTREAAIARILDRLPADLPVVATTGMASREVFEHRVRRGEPHDRDFLTVGGMGHASQIALGLALARPDGRVCCLDGDGAFLMHLGGAALIGTGAPAGFRHIVLNNAAHDSVGGQPTVADRIDLPAVARALGYRRAERVDTEAALDTALAAWTEAEGPVFLEVRVRTGARADLGRPTASPSDQKTAFMNRPILLNPGPGTTSEAVKRAAWVADICPREYAFGDVLKECVGRLEALADPAGRYHAALFAASGTGAVEAMIGSAVPRNGRLLVVTNGSYGFRMRDIARRLGIETVTIGEFGAPPSAEEIARALDISACTHMAVVHHETSTGVLNPLAEYTAVAQARNVRVLVDAMSTFGAWPYDFEAVPVDYLASSSNKGLQGLAGLAFVLFRADRTEELASIEARSLYLDVGAQWKGLRTTGQLRFTPPVPIVYAFRQALLETEAEGVEARHRRYTGNYRILREGMEAMGFRRFTPDGWESQILAAWHLDRLPHGFGPFHDALLAEGITIYPGVIPETGTFRTAVIGDLHPPDLHRVLDAMGKALGD